MSKETKICIWCNKEHHQEYDKYFCSKECEEKWDFKNEYEKIEDSIICPYCWFDNGNDEDYIDCESNLECSNCGEVFIVEAEVKITYTTNATDEFIAKKMSEEKDENKCLKTY